MDSSPRRYTQVEIDPENVVYVAMRHPAHGYTAWMTEQDWRAWLKSPAYRAICKSIEASLDAMGVTWATKRPEVPRD